MIKTAFLTLAIACSAGADTPVGPTKNTSVEYLTPTAAVLVLRDAPDFSGDIAPTDTRSVTHTNVTTMWTDTITWSPDVTVQQASRTQAILKPWYRR